MNVQASFARRASALVLVLGLAPRPALAQTVKLSVDP